MGYLRSEDDVRIFVEDLRPPGAQRGTVVLVHGWPLDHTIFEYLTGALTATGYRCVSIDLRGFGLSGRTARGYNYNCMSDDLCRVIRGMNLRGFTLCGFSMGGAVCARYMCRHQGYGVEALCLVGAALPQFARSFQNPCGAGDETITTLMRALENDRPRAVADFGRSCFNQPHSAAFMNWFTEISFRASAEATRACLVALRDESCRQDLAAICVPTAIFHGRQDRVCNFAMAQLTSDLIPGSVLYPYDESGHCCFLDQKEQFHAQFTSFISGEWI